jgi:hypothetical protein
VRECYALRGVDGRKPADADILVPGDTISLIGTTSTHIPYDEIDDNRVTTEEGVVEQHNTAADAAPAGIVIAGDQRTDAGVGA